MRVLKLTEAEISCVGETFARGCGSLLAVDASDVQRGKRKEFDRDGDSYEVSWTYIICPICGAKTAVMPNLSPVERRGG